MIDYPLKLLCYVIIINFFKKLNIGIIFISKLFDL